MTYATANGNEAGARRKAMNDGMADNIGRLRRIALAAMALASLTRRSAIVVCAVG